MGAVEVVASGANCVASVRFCVAFVDVFAHYTIAKVAIVAGAGMSDGKFTRLISANKVFTCSV
jgi:hypothetical protein